MCPKIITPHWPLQMSDTIPSGINKVIRQNIFTQIRIDTGIAVKPWGISKTAKAMLTKLIQNNDNILYELTFFTTIELGPEIDLWLRSML